MSKRKETSSGGETQQAKRAKTVGKGSKDAKNTEQPEEVDLPDETKVVVTRQLDYKNLPEFQGYLLSVSSNKNKSDVWDVFAKNKPAGLVKCTYCAHEYSSTSSNSTLAAHISSKHPSLVLAEEKQKSTDNFVTQTKVVKGPRVDVQEHDELLLLFLVTAAVSFDVVKNVFFRIRKLISNYQLPHPNTLRTGYA